MTGFTDRERGEEAKFALDEDIRFRIQARRNRLVAQWAAKQLGLTDEEARSYAAEVVAADFEEAGDDDVVRKLIGDLTAAGLSITEAEVRQELGARQLEAERALTGT